MKDDLTEKEVEEFWNVEIPWLGITKWQYVKWFLIFGIISCALVPILLFLMYVV